MAGDAFYTPQDALAFRRFALQRLRRPMVDLDAGSAGEATDLLNLSLASFRDLILPSFQARRQDGAAFRPYPAYLDCTGLDAFAAELDGVHLCGLHVGLAASCYEFALFCFAQETVFADIGESRSEISPAPIDGYPPGFWMHRPGAGLAEAEFLDQAKAFIPHDSQRRIHAASLAILMMRHVWLHELYHGLNGHVGLARDRQWTLCLHEHGTAQSAGVASAQLRCLELDADRSALYALCRIQVEDRENIEALRRLPLELRLRLSIFAGFAINWIIDEYARMDLAPASCDHPAPHVRLHGLVRTIASNLWPDSPNIAGVYHSVLADADAMAAILPSFPGAARMTADMRDAEFQAGLDAAQEALVGLRPDLAGFRYV